jgi:ADP-ribosylglycohydrolase
MTDTEQHKDLADTSIKENITITDVNAESIERVLLEQTTPDSPDETTTTSTPNTDLPDETTTTPEVPDPETPETETEAPKLSIKEVNNKIMGLVYGCVLGEILGQSDGTIKETSGANLKWGLSTDQLMLVMDTLIETGVLHVNTFMQKFQVYGNRGMLELDGDHNNIDPYTKEIVSSYEALSDPAKLSFDQFNKYNISEGNMSTCDNTTLIRCAMVGIYAEWDSFSFAATMSTHADHRCISAGVVIAAAARNMLIGRPTNISETVTDTAAMILSMKKMTSQKDINEYIRFTSEGYCTDLQLLNLSGGNTTHTYKCMAQSMYALGKLVNECSGIISLVQSDVFKNILAEIHIQGGDRVSNCALAGALMGCEIGYENLPTEWLGRVHNGDRAVLNNKVVEYLQHLGLVKPDERDFNNVLAEPLEPLEPLEPMETMETEETEEKN